MERSRRTFLLWSGAAVVGGVAAVAGARLLDGGDAEVFGSPPRPLPAPARVLPGGSMDAAMAADLGLEGASPLLTPNASFFRIDVADSVPVVETDSWRLSVRGLVERPFELSYDDLLDLPHVSVPITLACVSNRIGGGLIGTAIWQGVELSTLLERAGVAPGGTQVVGRSVDGFTAGFPTSVALDGRPALVAVGMNGEPLPRRHGFPARLVVAGLYGYVSATKWLSSIELVGWDDFDGYWITRDWAKEAPVIASSRIDLPFEEARIPAGPTMVAGVAWAPMPGVAAVEVRVDGGAWRPADLGPALDTGAWRQWRFTWMATPGKHTLAVRVIDADGAVQIATPRPVLPAGPTGLHQTEVTVT